MPITIRPKLDKLDKKILSALYRDARISKTQMSDEVGLSATRCSERMQRLEKSQIVRGYHADIDFRLLAHLSIFHVHVRLFDTTPPRMKQFEQLILTVHEIIACEAVLGQIDYIMTVVAPNTEAFQQIMDGLSAHENLKFDFITFPVSKHVKSSHDVSLMSLIEQD
jgi:Lrp/AsnC family transcriptional regulator, regulator of ectoine-degradation genes